MYDVCRSVSDKPGKEAIRKVVDLMPGEDVTLVIQGMWDSTIIATRHRVFICKRGMMGGVTGGSNLISWNMDAILGLQTEFGERTGCMALQTPNSATVDMGYRATNVSAP